MKKKLLNSMRVLLVAAGLCVGANGAWAQVTPYSNDYEGETPNVDWTSDNTGRYTVGTETSNGNTFLHVSAVGNGNNGTTITCSATNGKVAAGSDFYMSFDLVLEGANTSGQNSCFYLYDKDNNANTPILKIRQNTGGTYTAWTINDNTALTTGGKGTSNWYNYVLTRIGTKEYLTVTKKSNNSKVLDMVEITSLSSTGGLGNMQFATAKYYAGMYIDNVVLRALNTPAFTLSKTEVKPAVGENATVDLTGITGSINVSSDNTSVATASYSDGKITISGVADGVAYITVTAINDGAKTTQTITATVGAVATTTVTVNYLCGGEAIASPTTLENVNVGAVLTASDITYSNTIAGTGCRYANPSFSVDFPYTVVENGVINITYTKQDAVASLNVYAKIDDTNHLIKTYELDGKYVGDAVIITYPTYFLDGETLYSTARSAHGSDYYKWNYTLEGSSVEITYGTSVATNVVFYKEAEAITGSTALTGSNADIRCSDGTGAKFETETDVVELPAGIYTVYTQVWGGSNNDDSKNIDFNLTVNGNIIHTHRTTGSLNQANSSFTLANTATIRVAASGDNSKMLDYIYIVKTSETVNFTLGAEAGDSYKSYVTTAATDFAATGVTAYIATAANTTAGTVTLSTIDQAPANTPVLLKGTKDGTAEIATTTDEVAAISTNYLVAADGSTAIGSSEAKYVLAYNSGWEFRHYNGTLSAGKVYLDLSDLGVEAARLTFIFDGETTGIDSANSEETKVKSYYNLNGQRVNQPVKGLYIVRSGEGRLQGKNGKKVIIK